MKLWQPSIFQVFFQQFKRKGVNWRYLHISHQIIEWYIKFSMKLKLINIFVIIILIFCQDLRRQLAAISVTSINQTIACFLTDSISTS